MGPALADPSQIHHHDIEDVMDEHLRKSLVIFVDRTWLRVLSLSSFVLLPVVHCFVPYSS